MVNPNNPACQIGQDCQSPDECAWIFDRIFVYPTINFGSRIEWTLHPNFSDPEPYHYTLQVGRTGLSTADDWEDVGAEATDTYYLLDDTKRVYGKTHWTHYRVKLRTSAGTYYSRPRPCLGNLDQRNWRIAAEIKRKELLSMRRFTGQEGYVLKRRLYGDRCPNNCTDHSTFEVSFPQCPVCYGTGIDKGFFDPVGCVYAVLDSEKRNETLDRQRATVNDIVIGARMLAEPQLNELDVWVDKNSDERYYVHSIKNLIEIRGVPIVCYPVELRLIPFSDVVYSFRIDDQVPA